jgi:hypothetical protein
MDTERYLKIRKELDDIKGMIENVSDQMQELREAIRGAPFSTTMLPMSQPYQHPWWEYQRTGSYPCRNNLGGQVQASTNSFNETRSGVSGATKAA